MFSGQAVEVRGNGGAPGKADVAVPSPGERVGEAPAEVGGDRKKQEEKHNAGKEQADGAAGEAPGTQVAQALDEQGVESADGRGGIVRQGPADDEERDGAGG